VSSTNFSLKVKKLRTRVYVVVSEFASREILYYTSFSWGALFPTRVGHCLESFRVMLKSCARDRPGKLRLMHTKYWPMDRSIILFFTAMQLTRAIETTEMDLDHLTKKILWR